MNRWHSKLQTLGALTVLSLLAPGCYTTVIRSGAPARPASVAFDERWHHGVLWGIAEVSGPYDLRQACPQGWAEIETETSFLNGLLSLLTNSIYSAQTVSVRCSAASAAPVASSAGTRLQPRAATISAPQSPMHD